MTRFARVTTGSFYGTEGYWTYVSYKAGRSKPVNRSGFFLSQSEADRAAHRFILEQSNISHWDVHPGLDFLGLNQ